MRPQPNHLMDDLFTMLDFIKNEEKYTSRMESIRAQELAVAEKLKVLGTFDQAEKMKEQCQLTLDKLGQKEIELTEQFEKQKQELLQEFKIKEDKLIQRSLDLDKIKVSLSRAQEDLEVDRNKYKSDRIQFAKEAAHVTSRENAVEKAELALATKVAKLNQLMST